MDSLSRPAQRFSKVGPPSLRCTPSWRFLMSMSRRDLLKLSVFAGAAVALPLERSAERTVRLRLPHRAERTPCAVHDAVRPTAGAGTGAQERHHRLLPDLDAARADGVHPGPEDRGLGLQRAGAGPDHQGGAGPRRRRAPDQQPADGAPDAEVHAVDVGAPARPGLLAAVRRLRQRHHQPRPVQGLPLPELAERPDALVPRPRRPPHGRERADGTGGPLPAHRLPRDLVAPARRASSTCR